MLNHRRILKSIIDFENDSKLKISINDNFNFLNKSNVVFKSDEHLKIFNFIKIHSDRFIEVPSIARLQSKFVEDPDTIEELNKITKTSALYSSNFASLVEETFEEQQKKDLVTFLKETNQISESGLKVGKVFKKGPKDAVEYFLSKSDQFTKSERNVICTGSIQDLASESLNRYIDNKSKPLDGLLTGLPSLDLSCGGLRKGELWLVVAYVAELKTTITLNFAYTQAIEQGKNVQFVSLEMPFSVVKDIIICIHSANLNLWLNSDWHDVFPLDYGKILDSTLSQREEEFFEFLCKDLETNKEYGSFEIYQPQEAISMQSLKVWAEQQYRKKPFDIIYLDYVELLKTDGSKDYGTELNQRIKDLKNFALNFNSGHGVPIVSAYQSNRKGKEHADKNDGMYKLDGLSYANEAERSADVIISSYLNDELRAKNQAKISCLKNRHREKFKQFLASTHLRARKVYELPEASEVDEVLKKQRVRKIKQSDIADLV